MTDHLGSVREIVDDSGAKIAELDYDPYGNLTSTPDPDADRYQFTGREYEIVKGLYYYRARFYDPVTGRFVSEDPIGFAAGDGNLRRPKDGTKKGHLGGSPIVGSRVK